MAKQTINIGASPNDGTGTPLRTSFDYCNQNFTELYTATGPSGNNIVVPGNATITGDLTVDTSTLKVDSANNRVGILTASPNDVIEVVGSGATGVRVSRAGLSTQYTTLSAGATGPTLDVSSAIGALSFGIAGSTAMTLNSTGLGVGVSPSYKLDVSSSSNIVGRVSSSSVFNTGFNIVNTTGATWSLYSFGSNDATLQNSFGIYHQSGTSFLQITQAGNVGVGVTPSAWLTAVKSIDIQSGGLSVYSGGITHNAYYDNTDSRWEYKSNGVATFYNVQGGIHGWYVAASGTANNPITTFATAAMTLDASGNLLVGTVTSPSGAKVGAITKLSGVSLEGTASINVSTTPVVLSRVTGLSGLFFVQGYNTSGGAQGWWLVASTGGGTPTVIASGNSTGLTVTFTMVGGALNMNTASGTVAVNAFNITG